MRGTLLQTQPGARESGLFDRYVAVTETGQGMESEIFINQRWYNGSVVRLDDGFLVTFQGVDEAKAALRREEEARALLEGVLNATPLAINHLEAVLDERGEPVDFVFRVVNPASERIGGQRVADLVGHRLLERYPNVGETGVFEHYVTVWRTGKPWQSELFYEGEGLSSWFSFLVTKHGDGLVTVINDITERKRSELQHAELAGQVQAILDNTPVGIALLRSVRDETGNLVDLEWTLVNNSTARTVLLPGENIAGKRLLDLFPNVRAVGAWDGFYKKTVESGQPQLFETYYEGEGLKGWYRLEGTPLGDGMLLTLTEITDRKEAELAVERQRELLDRVLNSATDAIIAFGPLRDEQGRIVDFEYLFQNTANEQYTRLPNEEVQGLRMLDLFPDMVTTGMFDRCVRVVETGQPDVFEQQYPLDTGPIYIHISLVPYADGLVMTSHNLTELRHLQLEAERQAERFNAIVNSSLNGLIHWMAVRDDAGKIVDLRASVFNRAGCEMARISPEQFRTKTFLQLDPTGLFPEYERVIETGEPLHVEYFFGEIDTWFDVTAAKLGDGLVVSFSDVTPLKRAEQTQQRLADEYRHILDNALTAISHFTALRDDDGRIVDFRYESFNRMAELITGRKAEEIVGQRMLELFPGVGESGVFERWVRLVEGDGRPARFQDRYTFDGFDFWFDSQAVKWGDGFIQSYIDITPIKQAEQVQQRQAELFNQVINTSLNGILLLQPVRDTAGRTHDFRVRLFNQAAHDLTGLSWEWSQTRTLLRMNETIGTSGLLAGAVGVLETGEPLRVEFFFEPTECWFDVAVARLDDELVVTFSDISAVRESVIERQRHVATQQALLDGSINAILACEAVRDEAGTLVDFTMAGGNRAVEVMLNRPLSEVVGQRLLEVYPGNVQSGSFQRYKDTVETGQSQRFEMYYRADGLDTWFDIATAKSGDGLIISFLDVSEGKRAQQALVGESILFQALSSHVPETGVLVCSPNKRILFANGEIPAIFNRSDQRHLPGKHLGDVLRPEYRAEVMAAFRGALRGESQQTAEQYGEAYFEVFYSPVENAEGQTVMGMATFRNVTRDRLYQQQLKQSNENLERFAYVASHDLQEPLRKIQSFGDMLYRKQKDRLDESGLDLIGRMQASAVRMNELIRDLLTYSRVSSTPPEMADVSLPSLLTDVRNDLDLVIREKGATLRVDPLPAVVGDTLQLRQLFQNLLSNALKFSRPEVTPVVEVRHRPVMGAETEAMLLLQPDTLYHEISVSDNGIGFDEQYADRIFEAFQRLHGRAAYPGTGIGLAIVKKVVENHRGGLSVNSRVGEGSTFRVYLPVGEAMG